MENKEKYLENILNLSKEDQKKVFDFFTGNLKYLANPRNYEIVEIDIGAYENILIKHDFYNGVQFFTEDLDDIFLFVEKEKALDFLINLLKTEQLYRYEHLKFAYENKDNVILNKDKLIDSCNGLTESKRMQLKRLEREILKEKKKLQNLEEFKKNLYAYAEFEEEEREY